LLGQTTANAVIASRLNDGSHAAIIDGLTPQAPPGSGTVPGGYVPPSATGGGEMFPTWGTVKRSGITEVIRLRGSAAYGTTDQSAGIRAFIQSLDYANAVLQTQCGGAATALPVSVARACKAGAPAGDRGTKTAALFWNDPGTTMQPPGHWLQIADTVMTSQGLNELQEARLSALIGIAEADAGIAAWDTKYQQNLWRPITAINDCTKWNAFFTTCDASWASVINTPPHPDYVAGHPAFSGAAATVLQEFFGTDNIPFSSVSDIYCNFGAPVRDRNGRITGCSVGDSIITQCNDLPSGGTLFNEAR
jgi:hypothetical protein